MYFTQTVTKCDHCVPPAHCVTARITNSYRAGVWGLPGGGRAAAARARVMRNGSQGGRRENKRR